MNAPFNLWATNALTDQPLRAFIKGLDKLCDLIWLRSAVGVRKGLARNAYRGIACDRGKGVFGPRKRDKNAIFGSFLSAGEDGPA